ncbi:hypothetical protein H2203_005631 [Taxawa tesnikishii (nom. ined.)]|nr:hypothetical protein H2203_005631 [Dothideales sp. JES 119]
MDIPPQDDDFKWFGEGFEGFPKRLPEDCVEYIIYRDSRCGEGLDGKLLRDYIWQRDSFTLELGLRDDFLKDASKAVPEHSRGGWNPYVLHGRTNFGDSVADEWLVVYLLWQLSKQFPEAWIRVYDTDGEFLLIEAANALPKWLNPEVAENRVWMNDGHLKVIPLDCHSSQNTTPSPPSISSKTALDFITTSPEALLHSSGIEEEAFYRLREFPGAIAASLHRAIVSIPRMLAFILHANPSYVSPAVEAFYLRDPISMKPLKTKDTSTLFFPPEDFVEVSAKFTRVGYAQLRSQEFPLPLSWTSVLPHIKDPKTSTGMKLTCGFEMMLQDPQNQDKRAVREIKLLLEDIEDGEDELPSDAEVSTWTKTVDDEKWLDINYEDFEKELAGGKEDADTDGFGDASAQANLRKMVSRFEDFLNDESAGAEGAEELEDMDFDDDESTGSSELDSEGEDKDGSFDEKEFEQAMREMMGMPPDEVEKSGLLDEARKLALEMEEDEEMERDEDEEMKKIMEMYEKELKGHGALNLDAKVKRDVAESFRDKDKGKGKGKGK